MSKKDWKKQLKADPTDWLLEEENPAVRYLALRDIVDADEKELKTARKKAHKEGPIAVILNNMNPQGWWVHPGYVYTPKMMGTSWAILALAQMGGSMEEDKRIATACNYLLDVSLSAGGQFSNAGEAFKTYSCLQGNMLYALMDLDAWTKGWIPPMNGWPGPLPAKTCPRKPPPPGSPRPAAKIQNSIRSPTSSVRCFPAATPYTAPGRVQNRCWLYPGCRRRAALL